MVSLLEVRNVSLSFGGVEALDDCSFFVKKGLITGLIGPNGAGKTTVFNVICGLLQQDHGEVLFEGRKQKNAFKSFVSRTFQMPRLFDNMTIRENLLLAINDDYWKFKSRRASVEDEEKIEEVLKKVGLDKDKEAIASDLSYGQRKLLEIARSLIKNHEILLLDEPASGINPKIRSQLKKILKSLRKEGKSILVIEHDMEFVMDICDEIIVLNAGKKLVADIPSKVRKNSKVLEAYLGK